MTETQEETVNECCLAAYRYAALSSTGNRNRTCTDETTKEFRKCSFISGKNMAIANHRTRRQKTIPAVHSSSSECSSISRCLSRLSLGPPRRVSVLALAEPIDADDKDPV